MIEQIQQLEVVERDGKKSVSNEGLVNLNRILIEIQKQLSDRFRSDASGHGHTAGTDTGPKLSLTGAMSGILPVANGGTGTSTGVGDVAYLSNTTTPYTITSMDYLISCNATSGNITINLVTAVGISGKRYLIKKSDSSANTVIITPSGSETIDGLTTYTLGHQYSFIEIVSNNSNWEIITRSELIGQIVLYGSATIPTGWLLCDGTAISRATYAGLFTIIGTTFGVGNGSTTFNLPDLRDNFPIGKSGTKALGSTGGSATLDIQHTHSIADHTLTIPEIPAHTHIVPIRLNTGNLGSGGNTFFDEVDANAVSVEATGGGGGHGHTAGQTGSSTASVQNKYQAFNFIIKY